MQIIMSSKSPKKKSSRSLSKGGLTAREGLELLIEMNNDRNNSGNKQRKRKESKRKASESESFALPVQMDLPQREMTPQEIEKENKALKRAEEKLEELKTKTAEKEVIFHKLLLEIKRMVYIFNKVKDIDINTAGKEFNEEPKENKKLTVAQRRDNLEKGPHNLIFHGMEPDWIEAEMDDDPDFIKDVIGQRMRNMIKDELGIARDVGIIDCYRYYDGAPYNGAYPVIVQFKSRKEKEQLLWRSKDKLRKINIVVTDDISLRQKQLEDENFDPRKCSKKPIPESPQKKQMNTVEESLFGDFF